LRRGSTTVVGKISKHPIKTLSDDRVLILGESGGLVTAFFYEGLLGGLASSEIATNVLQPLLETNCDFTRAELKQYDREVYRILVDSYFKTNLASEFLFYHAKSKIQLLWETYCKFISEDSTIRRYIWEAIRRPDLENHDLERDRWAGEQIFKRLPFLTKATYWPHFIRAMFK
jgi:flavin-dependent dehydrogenase